MVIEGTAASCPKFALLESDKRNKERKVVHQTTGTRTLPARKRKNEQDGNSLDSMHGEAARRKAATRRQSRDAIFVLRVVFKLVLGSEPVEGS